jgi:putative FmdB family regulatory protein
MPLYEYKCEGCGEVFEVRQKFSDEPVAIHEKCGAPVIRLISAPSFQFKGSGWYVTDYGTGGNGPKKAESGSASSESKSSESKSSTETSTKTETKSATSTESKPASSEKSKSDSTSHKT